MARKRDSCWGFFITSPNTWNQVVRLLMSYQSREDATKGLKTWDDASPGPVFRICNPADVRKSVESLRIRILKASLEAARIQGRQIQRELDAARKSSAAPTRRKKQGKGK